MATPADDTLFLSVAIPAYNEQDRIGSTLRRVLDYLSAQPYKSEVVVVVDGGTDGTVGEIEKVAATDPRVRVLVNRANRGKGYSVRRAVLESRGRFVLFSDADLSTPIEQVEKLLPYLQDGYDMAMASRGLPGSNVRVRQPLWRQTMGRIFNWFVRRLTRLEFRDTQCGFKCFTHDAAQRIFRLQLIERFGFDVEVLWIARRLGYRIIEVPAVWVNSPASKVSPVRDAGKMLFDLVRIRYNDWRGLYDEDRQRRK